MLQCRGGAAGEIYSILTAPILHRNLDELLKTRVCPYSNCILRLSPRFRLPAGTSRVYVRLVALPFGCSPGGGRGRERGGRRLFHRMNRSSPPVRSHRALPLHRYSSSSLCLPAPPSLPLLATIGLFSHYRCEHNFSPGSIPVNAHIHTHTHGRDASGGFANKNALPPS